MNPPLAIGQILISIALIAAILLQARGTGLSGTFGGDSAVYRSRRGVERRLWQFTIVLLVLFILFALVVVHLRRVVRPPARFPVSRYPTDADQDSSRRRGRRRPRPRSSWLVGGVLGAWPEPAPAPRRLEPSAAPTLLNRPLTPYREAVVGVPEFDHVRSPPVPWLGAGPSSALVFSGLVRARTRQHLRARPRLVSGRASADWLGPGRSGSATTLVWQDGEPVTAGIDVVYTVEAAQGPGLLAGAMSSAWAEVTATTVDERTVRALASRTPIGGLPRRGHAAAAPRSHLLRDVPFSDLVDERLSPRNPVWDGAVRPDRAR